MKTELPKGGDHLNRAGEGETKEFEHSRRRRDERRLKATVYPLIMKRSAQTRTVIFKYFLLFY